MRFHASPKLLWMLPWVAAALLGGGAPRPVLADDLESLADLVSIEADGEDKVVIIGGYDDDPIVIRKHARLRDRDRIVIRDRHRNRVHVRHVDHGRIVIRGDDGRVVVLRDPGDIERMINRIVDRHMARVDREVARAHRNAHRHYLRGNEIGRRIREQLRDRSWY